MEYDNGGIEKIMILSITERCYKNINRDLLMNILCYLV